MQGICPSKGSLTIVWVLLAMATCNVSCQVLSTRTFVYTTPYLTVTELLKLGVDDFVFYLPLNESEWQNATLLFDDLRGNHGTGVFIVAGKDVNSSWTFEQAYTSVSTVVDAFQGHIDGFVCWDDPLSKGGADLRNAVVGRLRVDYPGVWFAVCLDLNRDRMEALEKSLCVDPLDALNLSLYDSVMAYYYTWIDASNWSRTDYKEMQGTMDSGALYWLQEAVDYTSKLGSLHGREIWFMHNAHSVGNLTVTTRQMELDLEISKRAGVPHIGWFTLDTIGKGAYSIVRYFGGVAAFDASGRYDFVRTILVQRAREQTLHRLPELPEPAGIVALLLLGLATVTGFGFDSEYQQAYDQGKRCLWGTRPEGFVRTIARRIRHSGGIPLVLDAGCGEGRHCSYLVSVRCRAVGVDVSRVALRRGLVLRDKGRSGHCLVLGTCSRLPFKGEVFDAVVDVFTFEFVRGKAAYLGEVCRVLSPGGTLFLRGHRRETGKEPHSIDEGNLVQGLTSAGMGVLSLWVSQSRCEMELEATKSMAPTCLRPQCPR